MLQQESLKYKHIVFDFGNVLAAFDEEAILRHFCPNPADIPLMKKAIFHNWDMLDAGTADYQESAAHAQTLVPERLREPVRSFYRNWYYHLKPIEEIWTLIHDLKARGASLYILSNAPVPFAEHADYYEIVREFDGAVFSAPIKMAKPEEPIYRYLFDTYHLDPRDCFFIDDRADNIKTARRLGMNGIIFTGDVAAVRRELRNG